jgi:hypothetical protein
MKRYFEGKSHADTYRIGQFLLSPEVVNFLKPNRQNLSIEAFYKNFYVKGTPTTEYENLTPNAKERVKDAYDALVNEGSDLKNVLIQADVLLETVDVISDIIAPSITNFLRQSRNKVLTDHIHKDIKTLQDALEAIDYESILSGEIANWDSLDDLSKFTEIQKAKILALAQATTPDKILQMIQMSPETMGSMEKFQIDYAGAVAKYLPGYDKLKSETKKVIDNLINSVLAQHSVVAFTESQMSLLLTDIITKITEDPIWKSAIEQA